MFNSLNVFMISATQTLRRQKQKRKLWMNAQLLEYIALRRRVVNMEPGRSRSEMLQMLCVAKSGLCGANTITLLKLPLNLHCLDQLELKHGLDLLGRRL